MIELLNLAGMPTGFGQTRSTSRHGVYRMVFRSRNEQVGRAALKQGHALLMAAINDEPFEVGPAVAAVRDAIDDCYLGPSTACIVAATTRPPHPAHPPERREPGATGLRCPPAPHLDGRRPT